MKVAAALEAAESQASNGARHLSELQAGRSRASTIQNVWFVMHQSLPAHSLAVEQGVGVLIGCCASWPTLLAAAQPSCLLPTLRLDPQL
jgi:hypothetical protein